MTAVRIRFADRQVATHGAQASYLYQMRYTPAAHGLYGATTREIARCSKREDPREYSRVQQRRACACSASASALLHKCTARCDIPHAHCTVRRTTCYCNATCSMQHLDCNVTCSMQHLDCNVTCSMQHLDCNVTCSMQHLDLQRATNGIHDGTHSTLRRRPFPLLKNSCRAACAVPAAFAPSAELVLAVAKYAFMHAELGACTNDTLTPS